MQLLVLDKKGGARLGRPENNQWGGVETRGTRVGLCPIGQRVGIGAPGADK